MFDNIEKNKYISGAKPLQIFSSSSTGNHIQGVVPAICARVRSKLDPGNVKAAFCSLQKKAVGTADLNKSTTSSVLTNEFDLTGKFAVQHRLAAEIVGISIRMPTGKIVLSVVLIGIKLGRGSSAEPTPPTAKNLAAVLRKEQPLFGHATAAWAVDILVFPRPHHSSPIGTQQCVHDCGG
jgi:hypothetical protein